MRQITTRAENIPRPGSTSKAGSNQMSFLNSRSRRSVLVMSMGAAFVGGVLMNAPATADAPSHRASAVATVFATGLVNPRGLTFGPDGKLYVAEGGYPVAPMT